MSYSSAPTHPYPPTHTHASAQRTYTHIRAHTHQNCDSRVLQGRQLQLPPGYLRAPGAAVAAAARVFALISERGLYVQPGQAYTGVGVNDKHGQHDPDPYLTHGPTLALQKARGRPSVTHAHPPLFDTYACRAMSWADYDRPQPCELLAVTVY